MNIFAETFCNFYIHSQTDLTFDQYKRSLETSISV